MNTKKKPKPNRSNSISSKRMPKEKVKKLKIKTKIPNYDSIKSKIQLYITPSRQSLVSSKSFQAKPTPPPKPAWMPDGKIKFEKSNTQLFRTPSRQSLVSVKSSQTNPVLSTPWKPNGKFKAAPAFYSSQELSKSKEISPKKQPKDAGLSSKSLPMKFGKPIPTVFRADPIPKEDENQKLKEKTKENKDTGATWKHTAGAKIQNKNILLTCS